MTQVILYWVLVLVMSVGIIGAVVPGIPGASLIVGAIVIWGIFHGFNTVLIPLIVAVIILALSIGIDFLATYYGAQKAGASNWGQIGSIIGFLLGVLGFLPTIPIGGPIGIFLGILLGPLLGAVIGEFLYRRNLELKPRLKVSFKAGLGIVLGSVIGNLIQGFLAFITVLVFLFATSFGTGLTKPSGQGQGTTPLPPTVAPVVELPASSETPVQVAPAPLETMPQIP